MTTSSSLEGLGLPLLHRFTDIGDAKLMNKLLRSSKAFFLINERDASGYCALHRACATGKYSAAKALLKHGADAKCLDWNGETPLHWAVLAKETAIVSLLLKYGANPLQASFAGKSPIDLAVETNHTSILQLLYSYCPEEFDPQWLMSKDDLQGVLRVKSHQKLKGMTRKAKAKMAELARRNWNKKYVVLSSKLMSIYIWSSDEQSAETRDDLLRIPYSTIVAVKLFMPNKNHVFGSRPNRIELYTLNQTKICVLVESSWKVKLWYDAFVAAGLLGASLAASRIQSMYRTWKARRTLEKLRTRMTDGLQIVQREASKHMVPVQYDEQVNLNQFELRRSRSLDIRDIRHIKPRRPQFIKRSSINRRSFKSRQNTITSIDPTGAQMPNLNSSGPHKYQGQGDIRGILKHRRRRKAVGVTLSSWKYHYFQLDTCEGCIWYCDCRVSCNCKEFGKASRIEFSQLLTCNCFIPMKLSRLKAIQMKSSKAMQRVIDIPHPPIPSKRLPKFSAPNVKAGLTSPKSIPRKRRTSRLQRQSSFTLLSSSPPKSNSGQQTSSESSTTTRFVITTTNQVTYHLMAENSIDAAKWVDAILCILPRENVSALAIQCCFRCYLARKLFSQRLQEKYQEQMEESAIMIQRFLRQYLLQACERLQ